MSTDISGGMAEISPARYISLSGVRNGQGEFEDLADFVKRVRFEKDLSQRDVEARSGGTISKGYIGQIENRSVLGQSVTPQKLSALAVGLGVSRDELIAVAMGNPLDESAAFDSEIRVAFQGFDELSDEDKRELLATVRLLGGEIQRRRPKPAPARKTRKKK